MNRVAVVTGASAGIGLAAAHALLEQGWRVVATGRDAERCAQAEASLKEVAGSRLIGFIQADLAELASARRLADRIAELTPVLHLLVNNAGGITDAFRTTSEGLEENFAGNLVGPWVLTEALMPLLRKGAQQSERGAVRIINTSSDGSERVETLKFDDIQNLANWDFGTAYCNAKLGNLLHVRAIAPDLETDGIVAHAFHPGTVDTNFISHGNDETQAMIRQLELVTKEDGADTLVWLATSKEAGESTGGYWYQRAPRTPNPLADDPDAVSAFRAATERLIASAG